MTAVDVQAYRAKHPPTAAQLRMLSALDWLTRIHGYPPTVRELGGRLKIRSSNGVNDQLKALERKGLLVRGERRARALVVSDEGRAALAELRGEA